MTAFSTDAATGFPGVFHNAVHSPDDGGAVAASDLGALPEWDLSDLYDGPQSDAVKRDLTRAKADGEAFEKTRKGRLAGYLAPGGDVGQLVAAIREYEELQELLGRLMSYASLLYSGQTTDPARAKFYGDVQEKVTAASVHLLFFELELNRVEDAAIEAGFKDEGLAHYRPWIEDIRKEKPYQLEDDIERLFHEKSVTGAGAWNRLFDETMAGLSFQTASGELGLEATLNLLQDPDEEKRKDAAEALAQTFSENLRTFTLITNTLSKDKEISDRWRGFGDVADSRHLANRVEPEVVAALVDAVTGAYPKLSHRYYAMKARWLGMDKLAHWDRNAPLPNTDRRKVSWDEASKTVLDAYGGFSPKMAEIADTFFKRNWIDAPVRPGKAPGAFSHPTVPSAHPYVLLNYQGRTRDVMTLAHELGHGVHQVLAAPQGALMAPTPLTLAETASVFGEMLTFQAMLKTAGTPELRKIMLAQKVEDMINTVVRQIAFYVFERRLHEARREGELTSEEIGRIWLEVQGESLGPAVELKEGYETYWTYIPHFIHVPFYVYAYAFGDCLVNSLYAVYEEAETGFQEKYFDMLKAGGTKHHSELLAPFGLDASDPAFWQKGLGVISRMIDELEGME
ncbi:oligoendopeptidase F [Rhodobium orientis]|uniref:Oligoendopeptidase F n=1 Tax=Rhodobium orientis TaxID=34017 RepID=A0A327JUY3_9HYPH|nr:M3 family oligoendopeptidase [Rhodobium orientis]MBB4302951.1 oligoendopeptidase F [Rhodobium orientis]MBK5949512.1 oligoendopeptidase F [Rhodobium orientis]RAI29303.1 oligoendopeptidase F [Rhodobium orientis]